MTEKLPKATHAGKLKIGDIAIPCAVLDDGRRVLTQRGLQAGLGLHESGGAQRMLHFSIAISKDAALTADISARIGNAIRFTPKRGGPPAYGFDALLLADICKAVRASKRAGTLPPHYDHIVERCELLLDGFAAVGIYALVDEATGYQADRDRDELQRLLALYIAPEFLPWTRQFPEEFYEQIYRLHGWDYTGSHARPGWVGYLTNQIVYERMPEGVLDELRRVNPTTSPGRRARKHHQYLTVDVGHQHLREHLITVTAMMRGSKTWPGFVQVLCGAFPRPNDQLPLFTLEEWKPPGDEE